MPLLSAVELTPLVKARSDFWTNWKKTQNSVRIRLGKIPRNLGSFNPEPKTLLQPIRRLMLRLSRFSFGVGDRFAHQASAQLKAFQRLLTEGVEVVPVWNKSNREHSFIGSQPESVRQAAQEAVAQSGWSLPWHTDADHIRLETVDRFLGSSDFYTIDVADSIGQIASRDSVVHFLKSHPELFGQLHIQGIDQAIFLSGDALEEIVAKYLVACQEAGRIYRYISNKLGEGNFIAEVSMDETDAPQTPQELLVILAALADQNVRLQTIAPKFTGRFNKGVDYVGDLEQFAREFQDDLCVLAHAVTQYGLPDNLKLSVHSGSDKFSIYPIIRQAIASRKAGLHIKTAGTTWLEELIGLAESGQEGTTLVREIYGLALEQIGALTEPYASVIDIRMSELPSLLTVGSWDGHQWANTLRHIPGHPQYNASVRQLLHVSFKLAAKKGSRYTDLLVDHREIIGKNVFENLYTRHMKPLFLG